MLAYENKWVKQIVELQREDGFWGQVHSLAIPTQAPITTEQVLRRLGILGLTKEDEPFTRALSYMETQLSCPEPTVFIEKKHDSKTYGDLMLAFWIRRFDPKNKLALAIARKWTYVISSAFATCTYCHEVYVKAYEETLHYLEALELLAPYHSAAKQLLFSVLWLLEHQESDGTWDGV